MTMKPPLPLVTDHEYTDPHNLGFCTHIYRRAAPQHNYICREVASDHAAHEPPSTAREPVMVCDTTLTPRRAKSECVCETPDLMGPCSTWDEGSNGRCSYCDHEPCCHPRSIEQGASAPETEPRRHRRTKRMDGQPWDACTCGWQANCFSWNAHAAKARKRGEIVETGEPPSAAIEATMSALYSVAVAMHESINAGRGATGWSEAGVREILQTFRADAVREERAKNTAALKWLKERTDWLDSEVRKGGTCYIERDQALYIHDKLRSILEGE